LNEIARERRNARVVIFSVSKIWLVQVAPERAVWCTERQGHLVNSVSFKFLTGGDDLRSDSLLEALIVFNDGSTLRPVLHQVNTDPWRNDTQNGPIVVDVTGKPPITHVTLLFNQGGGGINGDNWNMQTVQIFADGIEDDSHRLFIATGGRDDGNCVHRFKGHAESSHDSPTYEIKL
jgi:hypothetical protein